MKKVYWGLLLGLFLAGCSKDGLDVPGSDGDGGMQTENPPGNPEVPLPTGYTPCKDGMAGPFACMGFDLLARLSLEVMEASAANDIWGWTDPVSSKEYALVGLDNGTAFVDISDPDNLVYLGKLPTATTNSSWRDVKVFQNHAFIVSEANGHGLQVFDLSRLRSVTSPPELFGEDASYSGFGNAHNVVINEGSGYAYVVGTTRNDSFNGGVHFINIQDPLNPLEAGGYGGSGYTHDAQVITYNGPDPDHVGKELFIGANETAVVIVDVTDKQHPGLIADFRYANTGYTHQGWITEDHRYFILGDEGDEVQFGFNSRTLVIDFTDLDEPVLHTTYLGPTPAIDHNGYVLEEAFYLANYTAGMRLLDISDIALGALVETAYFDSFPADDNASFNGAWSVYPFFPSGKVVLSDINSGLFVLGRTNEP